MKHDSLPNGRFVGNSEVIQPVLHGLVLGSRHGARDSGKGFDPTLGRFSVLILVSCPSHHASKARFASTWFSEAGTDGSVAKSE